MTRSRERMLVTPTSTRALILSLSIIVGLVASFSGCGTDRPTMPRESGWYSLGFENHIARDLEVAWPYLYAGAGQDGIFRRRINRSGEEWEYMGLAHADMADTTFDSRMTVFVGDVLALDGGDILCGITSFAPWFPGLYRSTDRGASWRVSDAGIADTLCPYESNVFSLESSSCDPEVCFAATQGVIYKSNDRGVTWTQLFGYICGGLGITDLEVHTRNCDVIWATGQTNRFGHYLLASRDGGETWEDIDFRAVAPGATNAVFHISLDPFNEDLAYIWTLRGPARTTDGGGTWRPHSFAWAQEGFGPILFDDRRQGHCFVRAGDIYESWDGGKTAEALESPHKSSIRDMEYDSRRRILYVGTTSGVYKYVSP